jgi:hypothetical protein
VVDDARFTRWLWGSCLFLRDHNHNAFVRNVVEKYGFRGGLWWNCGGFAVFCNHACINFDTSRQFRGAKANATAKEEADSLRE